MLSQRHMFQQKKDDALKKIRDLGALPNDAFEKYKTFTMKQLFEKLDKTRISLREFGKINKKSLDQYTGFTEQKTELMERKQGQQSEHARTHAHIHNNARWPHAHQRMYPSNTLHDSI